MSSGLNTKPVIGWFLWDGAAQPAHTLLVTFVFAPYFASAVVGDPVAGQSMWGYMMTIVGLSLAILAPIVGSYADRFGPRKPWIFGCSLIYIVAASALWWAEPNMPDVLWILVIFGIGFFAIELCQVFINAMLPDLVSREDTGLASGIGWAVGYVGGLIALIIMLVFFSENDNGVTLIGQPPVLGLDAEMREGTRLAGPFSAIWYAVFVIPFFLWVPDVKHAAGNASEAVGSALSDLAEMIRSLSGNVSLTAYLGASMFYRDALNGLYVFGGIYAAGVLGWDIVTIGIFAIVALISGAIFSYLGGYLDRAFGPKPVIVTSIIALIFASILIIATSRTSVFGIPLAEGSRLPDQIFMLIGAVIGAFGSTVQAASRTMVAYQARPHEMTKAFGLYALAGKATAFLAPLLIAFVTDISGSQTIGISPVILLFLIGLALMFWVRPERG